jgi:hypothetical protein
LSGQIKLGIPQLGATKLVLGVYIAMQKLLLNGFLIISKMGLI